MGLMSLVLAVLKRRIVAVTAILIICGVAAYIAYGTFTLNVSSPATANGATSAVLDSATIHFPNGTAGPSCVLSGNSASCPQVFVRLGGGGGESGNYSIDTVFTASPAGDTVSLNCLVTGPFVCTFLSTGGSTAAVTSTGLPQTVSPVVKPTGLGSGTASVDISG